MNTKTPMENKSAHIENASVNESMERYLQTATLLTSAATALDSQWCEKDKNALLELAQSFREGKQPLTDAEKARLEQIFTPTPEELEIAADIDAVVEMVEKERSRYCELAPDCDLRDVMRAILKDRAAAYEQINLWLKEKA